MDTKSAIDSGDAAALRNVLSADPSQANALIKWGRPSCPCLTHPLHYVSDALFNGILPKGKELPLVDALIESGADVNYHKEGRDETPLIGAASLGAVDVGLRLLDAGAHPHLLGNGGETALHWAALFGELPLVQRLTEGADLELEDSEYHSTPLGWAVHSIGEPPTNNPADHGRQREVVAFLVSKGAKVKPEWKEVVSSITR